ncbi:chorion class high-cysteine HCB protein 13-like [Cydia amplana]|uniref:chorion class high-cysteine HCB protein 13-like n=1 Tax=Cydia amplana TaxID=1869771 RepID=UPI002FE666D5
MVFKVVILCAFAVLFQTISGQKCCSYGGSGSSIGSKSISISTSGGDFPVSSVGPISPSGIAVSSDLSLNGDLKVNGELPFLSAVKFSGEYDTKGSGCVDYSCGTCGNVAITSVKGGSGCGCKY